MTFHIVLITVEVITDLNHHSYSISIRRYLGNLSYKLFRRTSELANLHMFWLGLYHWFTLPSQSPIIHETNHERDHDIVIFDHEFVMLQCGSPDLVLAPACLGCCNRCSPVSIMSSL